MKHPLTPCHILLAVAAGVAAFAIQPLTATTTSPDRIWQSVDQLPAAPAGARVGIKPSQFKLFTVDRGLMSANLAQAPAESAASRNAAPESVITLPAPDGSFVRFRIEEVALMQPGLAAKYPEIKAYRGRALEDPLTVLHLDVNARTIHAQVLSPSGAWYIDPYWHRDGSVFMSYYKRDLAKNGRDFKCLVDGHTSAHQLPSAITAPAAPDSVRAISATQPGTHLRVYRLACATSILYSQYHGGTDPNVGEVLAALVTLNNRVSGVYETEFGVRMVLVDGQEAIISTLENPGPYTDTAADIQTNPPYLDQKIGAANYDIGHVVTTGSGGIAGLGVVCKGFAPDAAGSAKAQGTTGTNPPEGDGFWIDFVAHEMGHQFGGNHTFDGGPDPNCGANQNAGTAYEPGSGTTIQAYAGICSDQDLQDHSDAYFHFASLNEMFGYITSGVASRPAGILLGKPGSAPPAATPEATPSSGTLNPTGGEKITWRGTALGGASESEDTCQEGINCDTFTLTLAGQVTDWTNKTVQVTFNWPNQTDDYDFYVRKDTATGTPVTDAATGDRPEVLTINPAGGLGTGLHVVRAVYFVVAPLPSPELYQYTAEAVVVDQSNQPLPATCAVVTETGNLPPSVNAGSDFKIPARTPFALTAAGTDPNSDPLTYCWEEADLDAGFKDANAPDDGTKPIIRSYPPTPNPTRTIPRWTELLANQTQTRGEKLPTTNRTLNFRVTARDNIFGGWGMDSMKISVLDSGAGFAVTSPNTAVTLPGGGNHEVTWNVANTTGQDINTTHVNILLSPDATPANGDPTFPIVLAANVPNDGSQSVTLPNISTTKARIKVEAVGNIYFDISDANFTIASNTPELSSVVSRKTHGDAGTFDIPMPAFGTPGVECRRGSNGEYTLVFTFVHPLTGGTASASGTGSVSSSGIGSDPKQYVVNLSGVTNNQTLTVTLSNVTDTAGKNGSLSVPMRILVGDTNGDGSVNSGDATQTRNRSGSASDGMNFRSDVNTDGTINAGDAFIVRGNSGTGG